MNRLLLIAKAFLLIFILTIIFSMWERIEEQGEVEPLPLSHYVTLVITVPETHANAVREAMGKAGAGQVGDYSYCSYSVKGIGRFMPKEGAKPHQGTIGILEEVPEERIEVVCDRTLLESVVEEIKKAHPYEETVIDIFPIYELGRKTPKSN